MTKKSYTLQKGLLKFKCSTLFFLISFTVITLQTSQIWMKIAIVWLSLPKTSMTTVDHSLENMAVSARQRNTKKCSFDLHTKHSGHEYSTPRCEAVKLKLQYTLSAFSSCPQNPPQNNGSKSRLITVICHIQLRFQAVVRAYWSKFEKCLKFIHQATN